jgi:tetratricopeptide (TPR) repeat protein
LRGGGNLGEWQDLSFPIATGKAPSRGIPAEAIAGGRVQEDVLSGIAAAFRSSNGQAIAASALKANGVRIVEEIIRSGGGVRLIEDSIRNGFGDLLLQRLLSENEPKAFFNFVQKLDGPASLVASILPEGITDLRELDSPKEFKALFASMVQHKLGGNLLDLIIKSPGADGLVSDFLLGPQTRSVLVQSLKSALEPPLGPPQVLLSAVSGLAGAVQVLHEQVWDGKRKSRVCYKKIIQRYLNDRIEKRLRLGLDEALKLDHFALQSFKAIYLELFKNDLKEEATAFFNRHYQFYCKHSQMRDSLAAFLDACNREDEAIVVLETGAELKKNDYYYAKELAVKALKAKNYKAVDRWCTRMIRINPRIGEAYNILGVSLKKQGKIKKAIREYRRGVLQDPTNTKLLHNLAIALAAIGMERESLDAYRRAHLADRAKVGKSA